MTAEIESLRDEMLKWQDRRFDLLKHSTSVVTGLLGFKLVVEKSGIGDTTSSAWPLISMVLLLYLSGANLLTWYAAVANSKLAAYIMVFYEGQSAASGSPRWEGRLAKLKKKGLDPHNLNVWITVVYLVLAIVSVLLPYASTSFATPDTLWLRLMLACGVPFLATITLVALFSYPRQHFVDYWLQVKRDEESQAQQGT